VGDCKIPAGKTIYELDIEKRDGPRCPEDCNRHSMSSNQRVAEGLAPVESFPILPYPPSLQQKRILSPPHT
jgi:hypothetical protein